MYTVDGIEIARAKIDIDDVEKCKKYKWYLFNYDYRDCGYAVTKINKKQNMFLHKFITRTNGEIVIDHINCDKLDCRKENLRYANKSKNGHNRVPPAHNTSGFTGVSWNNSRNRWYVKLAVAGKKINLGSTIDLKSAILMRIKGEIKYFGEFRNPYNELKYIETFGCSNEELNNLIYN